jgi:hypothetical protein
MDGQPPGDKFLKRWLLFLSILFGSLCFALVFVLIFVNSTEVDCTLQSDESYTCQIRTLLFGKVQTFKRNVDHVVDIKVADDGCFDGCGYRAEFVTSDGSQVPLSEVYTDEGPVSRQVDALGSQFDRRLERITYTVEPPWWVLFLVGGLTLMSMLLSPLALRK